MADSKLRLQIVTALDNAGIKATKEQIAGLEKSLTKMNNAGTSGLQGVEKQLGNIRGPLGKLAPMFDGIGGSIAKIGGSIVGVIGAFKAGWDIGNYIQQKVINPLFGIKEPLEELKKKNKELQAEHQKTINLYEHEKNVSDNLYSNTIAKIDEEAQHVDKLNQAWLKSAKAKLAYKNADLDMEEQMLERNRFEDVTRAELEGDSVGAEQINRVYDVYKSMLTAKKEIQQYDQETALLEDKIEKTADKRWKILEKIAAAEKDLRAKEKEKENVENIATSEEEYRRLSTRANQRHYSAKMKLKRAQDELDQFDAEDDGGIEIATRMKQRQVLVEKLSLGIDKAMASLAIAENKRMEQSAKKLQEIQRAKDDYQSQIERMSEDSKDKEYSHSKNLHKIEDSYNNEIRQLENWNNAHQDEANDDEYFERLEAIKRKRQEALENENYLYAINIRNANRQYEQQNISTRRQLGAMYEDYDKMNVALVPELANALKESVSNFQQNGFVQNNDKLADMLEKLLELKQ